MYIYVYTHKHIHTHILTHTHRHTHTRTHTYLYTHRAGCKKYCLKKRCGQKKFIWRYHLICTESGTEQTALTREKL